MVRKKIKKFFLYVILLELKNSYKVNCAQEEKEGANKGRWRREEDDKKRENITVIDIGKLDSVIPVFTSECCC